MYNYFQFSTNITLYTFFGRSGYRRLAFRYIFFRFASKGCRSNP